MNKTKGDTMKTIKTREYFGADMTEYTVIDRPELLETCEALAHGSYQTGLIGDGCENWSGSSLRGKAREWGARYAASREALLCRIAGALEAYTVTTLLVLDSEARRWKTHLVAISGSEITILG
jgi:hypothetical protein